MIKGTMPRRTARLPSPREEVASHLPPALGARVPKRYERIGDVVLLKLRPGLRSEAPAIGRAYARALGAKTVLADRGVRGAWRRPDVEVLFGGDTKTVHVEDGIRYKLDVAKLMFSSGNVAERIRMGRAVTPGETVVDLFAGIGYFSLPMAVHGRAAKVIACEVNAIAFRYLEENVRLNRAWAIEPRLGDCRDVAPTDAGDRVVMGYLDGEAYLDVAMRAAKSDCVLHYHESTPIEEVPQGPWSRVEAAANGAGFAAELLAVHRIKSYAPRIRHVVLDVRLRRTV